MSSRTAKQAASVLFFGVLSVGALALSTMMVFIQPSSRRAQRRTVGPDFSHGGVQSASLGSGESVDGLGKGRKDGVGFGWTLDSCNACPLATLGG